MIRLQVVLRSMHCKSKRDKCTSRKVADSYLEGTFVEYIIGNNKTESVTDEHSVIISYNVRKL